MGDQTSVEAHRRARSDGATITETSNESKPSRRFIGLMWDYPLHILRAASFTEFGKTDASATAAGLSPFRRRRIHEPPPGRVFSPEAIALAGTAAGRVLRYAAAHAGREFAETRSDRSCFAGNRARNRATYSGTRT